MSNYGQFCPISLAAEIFAERWTPLILRELIYKPQRFSELHRGVPRMSRHLLVNRLTSLEDAGIVQREPLPNGRGFTYSLTPAGQELEPVVNSLGQWGYKWSTHDLAAKDLDPAHILWALRRYVQREQLPPEQVVILFRFPSKSPERYWLILRKPETDLCITDPGYDLDLEIETDPVTLSKVCLGHSTFKKEISNKQLHVSGLPRLKREFPTWFGTTHFAPTPSSSQ